VIKVAQDIGLLLSNPEQNAESEQNAVPLL
jgi:hypothetical protein